MLVGRIKLFGVFSHGSLNIHHMHSVGEFVAGQREGEGIYNFGGGCKYVGSWSDGRYEGVGTCVWADGRCYSGYWVNGMKHGQGIETSPDGAVRHEGQWANDKPVPKISSDNEQASPPASPEKPAKKATKRKEPSRRFSRWLPKKPQEKV
jgi:hypothetical protein